MTTHQFHHRRAYRRTDDYRPGTAKVQLASEALPVTLEPTSVLIQVHAVSLNYRDANIAHGGNPWPVTPQGILCNDAAGEIVAVGEKVKHLALGDRVAPIVDTAYISERSTGRSWLAADEDGVLADFVVFDEEVLARLPDHLDWTSACLIPCAGVTAWAALRDVGVGKTVLIQGTGGVSCFALKLARAAGLRVILSSSSDAKLDKMRNQYPHPPLLTVNYASNPEWHNEVLQLTDDIGVDLVLENGGTGSLIKSMKCTRRGGTVSQVGYLGRQDASHLADFIPLLIERRLKIKGINAGSKDDLVDLCAAISATRMRLDDIIDSVYSFERAEEAVEYLWQGKQVGKIVITIED